MVPARVLLGLSFLTLASACSSPPDSMPASEPRAADPHAPARPAADPAPSGELVLRPDAGWVTEVPTSSMRKAQYSLPHVETDSEDASLVVYFFGGGGGSPQANIERWTGQFEQPDGRPSSEVVKSATREMEGTQVTEVELSGTYVAETAPGSGEHLRKEGWRMLAAIVAAHEGPYYVKLVGPQATVARWETSYHVFVKAMAIGRSPALAERTP